MDNVTAVVLFAALGAIGIVRSLLAFTDTTTLLRR